MHSLRSTKTHVYFLLLLLIHTYFTIAADLGGIIGLFLGGSAISVFEIIDLVIYNAVCHIATRKFRKKTEDNGAQNVDKQHTTPPFNKGMMVLAHQSLAWE